MECLETIDLDELGSAARRFRSRIWKLGRGGSLAAAFPRSLRVLAAAGVDDSELLTGFLDSPQFGRFRLIPHAGIGLSAEESFASFLLAVVEAQRTRLAEADVLRETVVHELMIALCTALICEQPLSFVIDVDGIIETDRGHAALRWYSPAAIASWNERAAGGATVPYAYFATPDGLSHGPVSQRVTSAFETTPTAEGDTVRRALSLRGLW